MCPLSTLYNSTYKNNSLTRTVPTCTWRRGALPPLWMVSLARWHQKERHWLGTDTLPLANLDTYIITSGRGTVTPFTPVAPITLHYTTAERRAELRRRDRSWHPTPKRLLQARAVGFFYLVDTESERSSWSRCVLAAALCWCTRSPCPDWSGPLPRCL